MVKGKEKELNRQVRIGETRKTKTKRKKE